jgi:hypothetical protein
MGLLTCTNVLAQKKEHRRTVVVILNYLIAMHNLAFHGTNRKLYDDNSIGNFSVSIEMLAKFDPVI